MEENVNLRQGLLSLSPLLVFLALYFCLSVLAKDFYAVPITVAFMLSCLYALCILRGRTTNERIGVLAHGAADENLMLMIWIFILAGAFASTAKAMGAVEATVNLALSLLPSGFLLGGLFLAACIISLSVGTSVGTIAALTPIASEMSAQTGHGLAMCVAIVVGGAYFGDNLSFISDTTIMATKTQGCQMRDKFRMNLRIALPAAVVAFALYIIMGFQNQANVATTAIDWLRIFPYAFVLVAAACGMNVVLVLAAGILLAATVGLWHGVFDFFGWLHAMSDGVLGMSELIIVTLMAGGLMETIRQTGGITFILQRLTRRIHGRRGAEGCIAALVTFTDFCTANNTIAILTVGPLAKNIAQHYGVDPRRSASLLDTYSCFAQGLIPYGAQMLIASGLAAVNPLSIIPYLYYPFLLGGMATLNIIFHEEKNHSVPAAGHDDAGSLLSR